MTQPATFGGRPKTPAPGVPTPELRVARFRSHARRLVWPSLVLIVVAGAVGFLYGNLPAPFHNWMLLAAAAVVLFFLALWPFLAWWAHTWTITTRRVIERSGAIVPRRRELTHVRGYAIQLRRGPLQRMWGAGTLILSNGVDEPMRLTNVPSVDLVHECLVDQVEVNQILAHRELPLPQAPTPPPLPPTA
ncbi:PH domain-containing protein [Microbacterium sp. AZCO]|uniref:PH domain-containing protein n=1 Tax=Microbacterium sp. AZCO TaxID=3142976 RepID=UPI0031F3FA12